jgi:hypothetical protein
VAGKHESNSFSGVIIGEIGKIDGGSTSSSSTGIYGYKEGS